MEGGNVCLVISKCAPRVGFDVTSRHHPNFAAHWQASTQVVFVAYLIGIGPVVVGQSILPSFELQSVLPGFTVGGWSRKRPEKGILLFATVPAGSKRGLQTHRRRRGCVPLVSSERRAPLDAATQTFQLTAASDYRTHGGDRFSTASPGIAGDSLSPSDSAGFEYHQQSSASHLRSCRFAAEAELLSPPCPRANRRGPPVRHVCFGMWLKTLKLVRRKILEG